MPLYELFAIAKPALPKEALADIMRAIGRQVMAEGGVVTDIRSYGQRKLAYDIRQPGARYNEVRLRHAPLPAGEASLPAPLLQSAIVACWHRRWAPHPPWSGSMHLPPPPPLPHLACLPL